MVVHLRCHQESQRKTTRLTKIGSFYQEEQSEIIATCNTMEYGEAVIEIGMEEQSPFPEDLLG